MPEDYRYIHTILCGTLTETCKLERPPFWDTVLAAIESKQDTML